MKIAYFDCPAGASGDMLLGALVDAGFDQSDLRQVLIDLNLDGAVLDITTVYKHGLRATKVDVHIVEDVPSRPLAALLALIEFSRLQPEIKQQATQICQRIGAAEARLHGVPIDQIHLHELGGVDTLVDIVGTLVGLRALGIEQVYASPLPMGRGFTRSAHGPLPLPAPATLALLEGVALVGVDLEFELVTPTGAALLSTLARGFGLIPTMRLLSTGYGAGQRDLPIPNLLRVLIGDQDASPVEDRETLVMLETNLDDFNPQFYDHLLSQLFQAGALDVFLLPAQMKKNRPGTLVNILCQPSHAELLRAILFVETSTLGVRQYTVARYALRRTTHKVSTPFGQVRIKFARLYDGHVKYAPEYDDCRNLADELHAPLQEVYRAAQLAAESTLPTLTWED